MRYVLPFAVVLGLVAMLSIFQGTQTSAQPAGEAARQDDPFIGEWRATTVPDHLEGTSTTMTIERDGTLDVVFRQRGGGAERVEAEWWVRNDRRIRWETIRGESSTEGEIDHTVPGRLLLFLPDERPIRFEPAEQR